VERQGVPWEKADDEARTTRREKPQKQRGSVELQKMRSDSSESPFHGGTTMNGVDVASENEECAKSGTEGLLFDGCQSAKEALLAKRMTGLESYHLEFRDAETGVYERQWVTVICSQELYRRVFAEAMDDEVRMSEIIQEIGLIWLPIPTRWQVLVKRDNGFSKSDAIQLAIVFGNDEHPHYLVLLAPEERKPLDAS
jgi:hypothetical protein